MRALLVCGAPVTEDSERIVRLLAARADQVIAVDSGGALCRRADVLPHMLAGDLDSLDPAHIAHFTEAGVPIVRYPADKDVTDLDIAVAQARSLGCDEIVATACLGGRLDHTLGVLGTLARCAELSPVIVGAESDCAILSPDGRRRVTLSGEGTTVSTVALLGSASVSATGVKWPLESADLDELTTLGVSNVIARAQARIECHIGCLAVVVPTVDGHKARLQDDRYDTPFVYDVESGE